MKVHAPRVVHCPVCGLLGCSKTLWQLRCGHFDHVFDLRQRVRDGSCPVEECKAHEPMPVRFWLTQTDVNAEIRREYGLT